MDTVALSVSVHLSEDKISTAHIKGSSGHHWLTIRTDPPGAINGAITFHGSLDQLYTLAATIKQAADDFFRQTLAAEIAAIRDANVDIAPNATVRELPNLGLQG